ncbi:MAG: hypothetical protein ACREVV_03100 [Steroidobacteraceae bacterium]
MQHAAQKIEGVLGDSAFQGDAHALLVAIYKDENKPLPLRLDAAKAAIGYEKPRLSTIDATLGGAVNCYEPLLIPVSERQSDRARAATGL